MKNRLWGPFCLLPNCRLWLAEGPESISSTEAAPHWELFEASLTERDRERLKRYRPFQKKRQFLNSRLAVRDVLRREFEIDSAHVFMDTTESGQPILLNGQGRPYASISLSHTDKLTAIAISNNLNGPGIDIEVVQPLNTRAFSLSFLNQAEKDWMADERILDDQHAMLIAWTLKEAFWKALGGPQKMGSGNITTEYSDKCLTINVGCMDGNMRPFATHFFGHQFVAPVELKNFTSIDGLESDVSSFVGCIVLVSTEFKEGYGASDDGSSNARVQ